MKTTCDNSQLRRVEDGTVVANNLLKICIDKLTKFKIMNNADRSFCITKKQYNYLLPIFGASSSDFRISERSTGYYFVGTYYEYLDALNRCKYLD